MNIQKITKTHLFPKGFTLIELIVVITILAILGTIGFLSIGGYSSKARDSARIGDLSQTSKSLDLAMVTSGSYPLPDGYFSVTYSGGVVWNQGTIGNNVLRYFKGTIAGGGLNEKPVDPLKNTEYIYSTLTEGKAYQLKAEYEGDLSTTAMDFPSLTETAYAAAGNPTIAYVRGNFWWPVAKVSTGSILYVLAVPSIITNSGSIAAGTFVSMHLLSGSLIFNGKTLINASTFNPSQVAYSGAKTTTNPSGLPDTSTWVYNMMLNLKSIYSISDIQNNANINTLLNTTTGSLTTFGTSIINAQLGGGNGGGNTITSTDGVCGSANGAPASTTPVANLCSSGTLSGSVIGSSAPWTWACNGSSGGVNVSCSTEVPLYTFTTHSFTNCGATGRFWPALSTCQSSYNATEVNTWKATYLTMTVNGIQEWTVPFTATYRIDAYGAAGGWSTNWSSVGGLGARMKGDFSLNKGDKIKILVWQAGADDYYDAGGGGGTFVTTISNTPLVIAAGGGGGSASGFNGTGTKNGGISTSGSSTSWGAGGTGGNGGVGGTNVWGGGWLTTSGSGVWGGQSFILGGLGVGSQAGGGFGGGGGGGGTNGAGGGGGYSGGGYAPWSYDGAGGGSINNGTNQTNTAWTRSGNGMVTITKL